MRPTDIALNGRFLSRPVTGVERYAHALMGVLPQRHQVIREGGLLRGHAWEQLALPLHLSARQLLISPANTGPLAVHRQVIAVHDLAFWHHPEWFAPAFARAYRWLLPRLVKRVAHVITPSEATRQDLMRTWPIAPGRITVVPPYVPAGQFVGNDDPGIEGPYYLFVGSMDPRKGLDRAMAWYASLTKPAFELVVVGRTVRSFQQVARPVVPGVLYLDDVDDARLGALYRRAVALLVPSHHEGFGLPILEALSLGCPVIASDLPVFRESFDKSPLYSEIGGTRSMVEAMIEVHDTARRAERIAAGTAIAARFTPERTTAALHQVLLPLLDRPLP